MDETSPADALTHRLVVQRLEAPGVLDRQTLERTHDRFSHAANAHVVPRLHRRSAPTASNAGNLPLVRIDRSVEPGAATVGAPIFGAAIFGPSTQTTGADTATRPAQRVESASTFAGSLAARHAPGISHTSTFVARRAERDVAGDAPVASRLLARADRSAAAPSTFAPPIITRAAATSVVQRVVDAGNRARVAAPTPSASAIDGAPVRLAASPLVTTDVPQPSASRTMLAPAKDASPTTATNGIRPAIRAVGISTSGAPSNLVLRKANPTQGHSASAVPVVTPAVVTVAPPQLLLRKPDVGTTLTPAATSTRAPSVPASRAAAASPSTPMDAVSRHAAEAHIDWIAEQVGNRLARRLEIERERMGVRRWRQVS